MAKTMYEVLEALTAPAANRWVLQHVIRCDTYEEACRWAQFLSGYPHGGIPIGARYHVLAKTHARVVYTAP
jgi:hypothetical protein